MQEERINILILKRMEGSCTEPEEAELQRWLKEDERHRRHFEQLALVHRELDDIPLERELDAAAAWQSVRMQMGERPGAGRPIKRFSGGWRIAAAVAALIGIGWLLYATLQPAAAPPVAEEVVIPPGETRELALPDGSSVRINADSRLLISAEYGKTERRLDLSGEAYFTVVENAGQPFIVRAGKARVEVAGTAFNVSAREESGTVDVAVVSGAVRFRAEDSEGLILVKGQAGEYDIRTGVFRELPEGNPAALAWLEGRLVFKDTPLNEVFRTLERRYAVHIENRTDIGEQALSDTIEKGAPLAAFLERLSITFGISWRVEGDTVVILPGE